MAKDNRDDFETGRFYTRWTWWTLGTIPLWLLLFAVNAINLYRNTVDHHEFGFIIGLIGVSIPLAMLYGVPAKLQDISERRAKMASLLAADKHIQAEWAKRKAEAEAKQGVKSD